MCPPVKSSTYHSVIINQRFDLSQLQRQNKKRYPFLLETGNQDKAPENKTGFDILFAFPQQTLVLRNGSLSYYSETPIGDSSAMGLNHSSSPSFLSSLERWCSEHKQSCQLPDSVPFAGGWFVYLGYELAGEIEPVLNLPQDNSEFPTAFATQCPSAIIYDHRLAQTTLVSESQYKNQLNDLQKDLAVFVEGCSSHSGLKSQALISDYSEEPATHYTSAVDTIKDYICEGDVFQVNLSRLWSATLKDKINEFDIYDELKKTNPAPFAGLVSTDYGSLISSSPERLISCKAGMIQTRPIAGTRPRGSESEQDLALAAELMVHPKEIAEHIMLVDLERNDMGRVCVPGSIKVNDLMGRESYAKVHHIVSNIIGRIRPAITPVDILRAVFPGGTITGCPKVRCMEIIAELEQTGRGPYTGSMGYINYNGDMDFNILIRTFQMHGEQLSLRAGAGIVFDSNSDSELQETRAKAAAMLDALGVGQI